MSFNHCLGIISKSNMSYFLYFAMLPVMWILGLVLTVPLDMRKRWKHLVAIVIALSWPISLPVSLVIMLSMWVIMS